MYKIAVINTPAHGGYTPEWDTLPVAKLTCPGEGFLCPIFAQAVLCCHPSIGLYVRLWAFEVESYAHPQMSSLSMVLAPNRDRPDEYAYVSFTHGGDITAYTVDAKGVRAPVDTDGLAFTRVAGEDLQGEYWGGSFMLPNGLLKARFGIDAFSGGEQLKGNLAHQSTSDGELEFATLYTLNSATPNIEKTERFGTLETLRF